MKNLLLILALFVVGCSSEEDTRLICDCLYYQKDTDSIAINYSRKVPLKKFECEESRTLVFNASKNKFKLEGIDLGKQENLTFTEDKIFDEVNYDWRYIQYSLNRVSLIFKHQSGINDDYKKFEDDYKKLKKRFFALLKFEDVRQRTYQCRTVEGV